VRSFFLLFLFFSLPSVPRGLFAAGDAPLQLNPASSHQAEVKALGDGVFSILTSGEDP
jgi:hypothetical protein